VRPGAFRRASAPTSHDGSEMPSYVKIGATSTPGNMTYTWATCSVCADRQNVHLLWRVGIGGVARTERAAPVRSWKTIAPDQRGMIVNGATRRKGASWAGVILKSNTQVIDSDNGEEVARVVIPSGRLSYRGPGNEGVVGCTIRSPCELSCGRWPKARSTTSSAQCMLRSTMVFDRVVGRE